MSGRIFQNVVLQLKENTDRTVGVIDGEGVVIACSELSMIGQRWSEYVAAVNGAAGSMVCFDGKTFKALSGWGNQFDYAVFAFGDNEISKTICSMATVALNAAKSYYEEKHDRGSFVKDIISDNIMLGDIYMRAKELRVATDVSRGIFAIRALQKGESVPTETIQAMFPDRQNDFVLSVGEGDVVLIRQLPDGAGSKELNKTAAQIEEALRVNGESTVVVGMGTIAMHLRDLAKSYKDESRVHGGPALHAQRRKDRQRRRIVRIHGLRNRQPADRIRRHGSQRPARPQGVQHRGHRGRPQPAELPRTTAVETLQRIHRGKRQP